MEKRAYRCDQCTKRHVKCDKLTPKCTTCTRRKEDCTLNRVIIYNRKKDFTTEKFSRSKGNNKIESIVYSIKYNSDLIQTTSQKFITNKVIKILKHPKDHTSLYPVLAIFHRFTRKSSLENLMTLTQNPSPFTRSIDISIFVNLAEKLQAHVRRPKLKKIPLEVPREAKVDIAPILKEAIANYFKYNNTFFPLFIEEEFNFSQCPFYLKLAILSCGLVWMEQTKTVQNLSKYFEGKLFEYLHIVYRINPTLENIQVLLITVTSLTSFSWVCSLYVSFIDHCYRISSILSLHSNPKFLKQKCKIERSFAYCLLSVFYCGALMVFGSFVTLPNIAIELLNLEKEYKLKVFSGHTKYPFDDLEIKRYYSLKLIQFYNELCFILFPLRLLKERCMKQAITEVELASSSFKIISSITKVRVKYIDFFGNIFLFTKKSSLYEMAKDLQNCVNFFYHYIRFFVYSFQFYFPKYRNHIEKKDKNIVIMEPWNGKDYAKLTLSECYSIIDFAYLLSHKYVLTLDCSQISICLVFMLRYGGSNEQCKIKLQKGLKLLQYLSTFPCSATISKLNLNLYGTISNDLKK
ncbi:hypothetical protein K502DRAFT_350733 [Neoconidiobolus thromboides FSU 785]|nr:hypothetical protein K502DRAFT_350733 [Neoconidiobolus thromboides FSU 785]